MEQILYMARRCLNRLNEVMNMTNFWLSSSAGSISQIANIPAPLKPLLRSHNNFMWTEVHEITVQNTKKALSTAPTLAYFRRDIPCTQNHRHRQWCRGVLYSTCVKSMRKILRPHPPILSGHAHFEVCTIKNWTFAHPRCDGHSLVCLI